LRRILVTGLMAVLTREVAVPSQWAAVPQEERLRAKARGRKRMGEVRSEK
jgi:hypothetical protein